MTKEISWLTALLLLGASLSACGDDDDPGTDAGMTETDGGTDSGTDGGGGETDGGTDGGEPTTGRVRVWHLADAAGTVDVYVNGTATFEDFEFEQNTAYVELDPGMYDIAVTAADAPVEDAVITVEGFELAAGDTWTIIAAQLDADAEAEGAFQAIPVSEDATAPADGNIKVQTFHLAYGVEAEVGVFNLTPIAPTLTALGPALAQGAVAEEAEEIAAGAIQVGADATADGIVDLATGVIEAPPAGSSVLLGFISKAEGEEVETEVVYLIGDGENIQGESELAGVANARIWHLAPSAEMVDIYLGGTLALAGVAFEQNTLYLPFPEGMVDVAVVPAGGMLSEAVIEATLNLVAGEFYTVVAWQDAAEPAAENFQALVIPEDRAPPAETNIKVRVFHVAYAVSGAVDVYDVAAADTAVISDLAQGMVADVLDVPNGEYTFGLDVDDDMTLDRQMASALPMPPGGSFVTLGVLSKPGEMAGDDPEVEVVFLVNNGVQGEVELEVVE